MKYNEKTKHLIFLLSLVQYFVPDKVELKEVSLVSPPKLLDRVYADFFAENESLQGRRGHSPAIFFQLAIYR